MEEKIIEINLEEKIREDKRNKINQKKGFQQKKQKLQAFRNDRFDRFDRNKIQNEGAVVEITDLHYSVTNDELRELAEQFGKVRWAKVKWDKIGRSLEQGSIEFIHQQDARKAVEALNNTTIESLPMKAQIRDSTNKRGYFKRQ